jgi:hypothetical protein
MEIPPVVFVIAVAGTKEVCTLRVSYPILQEKLPLKTPVFGQLFVPLMCVLVCVFVFVWLLSAYATGVVAGNAKPPISNAIAANAAIATYVFVFMWMSYAHIIFKIYRKILYLYPNYVLISIYLVRSKANHLNSMPSFTTFTGDIVCDG